MEDLEILFVDDEAEILDTVGEYLSREGYAITLSDNGLTALGLVKEKHFDIVFTDLKMPEFDGLELLTAIKEHRPEIEVIIVTGYGTIESAIMAMKFGGYDYIQKPIKLSQLKMLCEKIMAEKSLRNTNLSIMRSFKQRNRYEGLIGMSPQMQKNYEILERIGRSSPSVLIHGEKGTGKELIARVIHKKSDRADTPFVPVNCSALVEGPREGDLLDHLVDLFDAARGGTIFLDEIAEIPISLQAKLLRPFQQEDVSREDDGSAMGMDVRVIAATEKDMDQLIKIGIFKEDLFYRADRFFLKLPPLRERREDICLLVNHFLKLYGSVGDKKTVTVSQEVMDLFIEHHWPGNVGQLEYILKEAINSGAEKIIDVADLPREMKKLAAENMGVL